MCRLSRDGPWGRFGTVSVALLALFAPVGTLLLGGGFPGVGNLSLLLPMKRVKQKDPKSHCHPCPKLKKHVVFSSAEAPVMIVGRGCSTRPADFLESGFDWASEWNIVLGLKYVDC